METPDAHLDCRRDRLLYAASTFEFVLNCFKKQFLSVSMELLQIRNPHISLFRPNI
jgi:hypothetical protein